MGIACVSASRVYGASSVSWLALSQGEDVLRVAEAEGGVVTVFVPVARWVGNKELVILSSVDGFDGFDGIVDPCDCSNAECIGECGKGGGARS